MVPRPGSSTRSRKNRDTTSSAAAKSSRMDAGTLTVFTEPAVGGEDRREYGTAAPRLAARPPAGLSRLAAAQCVAAPPVASTRPVLAAVVPQASNAATPQGPNGP